MKKYFKTKDSFGFVEGDPEVIKNLNLNEEEKESGSGGPMYVPGIGPDNEDYYPPARKQYDENAGSGGSLQIPGVETDKTK